MCMRDDRTLGPDDFATRQRLLYGTTTWKASCGTTLRRRVRQRQPQVHHAELRRGSTRVMGTRRTGICSRSSWRR